MDVQCEKSRVGKTHFQVICLGIWVGVRVIYKFVEKKVMDGIVQHKLNFIHFTRK